MPTPPDKYPLGMSETEDGKIVLKWEVRKVFVTHDRAVNVDGSVEGTGKPYPPFAIIKVPEF